jgi:ATP-dependent DNA helicase 2 subunit 1
MAFLAFLFFCSKTKLASKRIIIFTNNDNPHEGRRELQRQARQKAQDLKDNDVEIELMPLGHSFKNDAFYNVG